MAETGRRAGFRSQSYGVRVRLPPGVRKASPPGGIWQTRRIQAPVSSDVRVQVPRRVRSLTTWHPKGPKPGLQSWAAGFDSPGCLHAFVVLVAARILGTDAAQVRFLTKARKRLSPNRYGTWLLPRNNQGSIPWGRTKDLTNGRRAASMVRVVGSGG